MTLAQLKNVEAGIVELVLNDPARRNAMGEEMALAFRQAVHELADRPGLRAVVISGNGVAFSAGGDLAMLRQKAALDREDNRRRMLDFYDAFLCMLQLPVPIIAAINGHAIGAGLCLAIACDLRIVAANAKLGFTFTRLGIHPGMGATWFLPRVTNHAAATELLVTGRIFTASEAKAYGLVTSVVEPAVCQSSALELAKELLLCGPQAVAGLLETLRPRSDELRVALEREAEQQSLNYRSAEFLEGIDAALEKRPPRFRGELSVTTTPRTDEKARTPNSVVYPFLTQLFNRRRPKFPAR